MELNLSRQDKLVPIKKLDNYNLKVFGVGSIGSYVVRALSKTGFKAIEVYDMDKVDKENIGPQAFDFKHIGMNKVDAMVEIVKESAGIDIVPHHGQIIEETQIDAEPNTIYCCFFDSFEGRKLVFNKLKEFPVIFVDGRIGKFDMRHYLINTAIKEYKEDYETTLSQKAVSKEICGEKASAPINMQLAGMIVSNIVNYISEKDYTRTFLGNAATPANNFNILKTKEKPEDGTAEVA